MLLTHNDPYEIKRQLWSIMDRDAYVFRDENGLTRGLKDIRELIQKSKNITIKEHGNVYNQNLIGAFEMRNLVELAEVVVAGALERRESRGSHFRTDYPKRDDENFLKHTIIKKVDGKIAISYIPVKITKWQPKPRVY